MRRHDPLVRGSVSRKRHPSAVCVRCPHRPRLAAARSLPRRGRRGSWASPAPASPTARTATSRSAAVTAVLRLAMAVDVWRPAAASRQPERGGLLQRLDSQAQRLAHRLPLAQLLPRRRAPRESCAACPACANQRPKPLQQQREHAPSCPCSRQPLPKVVQPGSQDQRRPGAGAGGYSSPSALPPGRPPGGRQVFQELEQGHQGQLRRRGAVRPVDSYRSANSRSVTRSASWSPSTR